MAVSSEKNITLNQPPQPSDSLKLWEDYLELALSATSGCRVRQSRLESSAQDREQKIIKRLSVSARQTLERIAISEPSQRLQRQALELIRLRRRLIPDDSDAWQRIEVFLAAAQLHQALNRLLDEIETLHRMHEQVDQVMVRLQELLVRIGSGQNVPASRIQYLNQWMLNLAADSTMTPRAWLTTCSLSTSLEQTEISVCQRQPLTCALQAGYLVARMIRSSDVCLKTDALLAASLLKDVSFWHPRFSHALFKRDSHAEWSAALLGGQTSFGVGLIRLIRQHHESLDGSGMPFGVNSAGLLAEDRILGVVTRWAELYDHQVKMRTSYSHYQTWDDDLEVCNQMLCIETGQGRWDGDWLAVLQSELGLPQVGQGNESMTAGRRLNDWTVPRPHFLQPRFPVLGANATASVPAALHKQDRQQQRHPDN